MTRHALRPEYGLFAGMLGAMLIGQMPAIVQSQTIDLQIDPVEQVFEDRLDGLGMPGEVVADPAASGMMREGIKVDVENPARALFRALKQSAGKSRRDFLGIYMADLNTGEVVPVVDSRRGEFTYYGSPQLSPDGSRIVYDASPGKHFGETHIFLAQLEGDSIEHVDLGVGNCPAFSPDGKLIAFLLNPGPGERGTPGLWIMNADGSRRQRLTDGSIPEWSPDEMRILDATFSSPVEISFLNARDGQRQLAQFPMHRIYSIPNWVDANTVVTLVVSPEKEQIALLDVSNPSGITVKKTLLTSTDTSWRKKIAHPVYSAARGECVFVHRSEEGMSLQHFKEGEEPKPFEEDQFDNHMAGLFISPHNPNYLLFCSDRRAGSSVTKSVPDGETEGLEEKANNENPGDDQTGFFFGGVRVVR